MIRSAIKEIPHNPEIAANQRRLLEERSHPYSDPLIIRAAEENFADLVIEMLKNGENPNQTDSSDVSRATPLFAVCWTGGTSRKMGGRYHGRNNEYIPYREGEMERIVDALLAYGADPNKANAYGQTPLEGAAISGYLEPTKMLVENGANLDRGNVPPIRHAATEKNFNVVEYLEEQGALVPMKVRQLQAEQRMKAAGIDPEGLMGQLTLSAKFSEPDTGTTRELPSSHDRMLNAADRIKEIFRGRDRAEMEAGLRKAGVNTEDSLVQLCVSKALAAAYATRTDRTR